MMIAGYEDRFLRFLDAYSEVRDILVITLNKIPACRVIIQGLEIDAILRRELLLELERERPLFEIVIRALPAVGAIGAF